MNLADERAVWSEDVHAVEAFTGPSGGGPNVAIGIATDAIGGAGRHVGKQAAILEPYAIDDVVDSNGMGVAGMARGAGIHDAELFFVEREANAVGLIHIAGDDGGFARFRIEAVHDGRQLEGSFVTFGL